MNINGKITLFVKRIEKNVGQPNYKGFNVYSGSIGSKQEDESYVNASIEIKFDKENFPFEKLDKLNPTKAYTLNIEEGWLGARAYQSDGKDRRVIYIFVKKAIFESAVVIKKVDKMATDSNDLPF